MNFAETPAVLPGRSVPAAKGVEWITEGWRLFAKAPLMWILSMLVVLVIFIVLGFIPLLGQLAGFILKPILFAGFMIGCHSLAAGGDFELEHVFAGFRHRLADLVILALVVLAGTIAIFAVTVGFIAFTIGLAAFTNDLEDFSIALATALPFVMVALLIMLALLLPLAMAYWFAPALIILNGASPGTAMKASFGASLRNFLPFLVYGLVMFVLLIVASIPLGLGLLVWVPLALTSTYAAYRSMFAQEAAAGAPAPPVA